MSSFSSRNPGFYKRLWTLSLPVILQNLITFSLGLIDTFMVSQLGNKEMAAVTTANVPVFLLISIVFGVQSGLGILVSQYWGKGDTRSINRAIGVAAFIGTGITVVLAVVFFLFPVQVMDLLSNSHELSLLGAPYLRVIGFSYVFNMLSSIYFRPRRLSRAGGGRCGHCHPAGPRQRVCDLRGLRRPQPGHSAGSDRPAPPRHGHGPAVSEICLPGGSE